MKRFEDKDVKIQFISDFGMTVELNVETEDKKQNDQIEYPLLKVYADEQTEEMYMKLVSKNKLIQLPLTKIKELIESAEKEVHSESWFNKNVFNQK